jgi:hypothetical protein
VINRKRQISIAKKEQRNSDFPGGVEKKYLKHSCRKINEPIIVEINLDVSREINT